MLAVLFRRIVQLVLTMLGASLLVVGAVRLSGDPAVQILGPDATAAQLEALRKQLGLDRPFLVQYFDFISGFVRGDWGYSYRTQRPVSEMILEALPTTVSLVILSLIPAVILGLILGARSGVHPGKFGDQVTRLVATLGLALPSYWGGLLLIQFVALPTGWFPVLGGEGLRSLVLPAISLGFVLMASMIRFTRSSMLENLSQDYVRTARGKGLSETRVVYGHALKNAAIPVTTIIGLEFGSLLGGAVITETVFSLSGVGRLLLDSISARDYPTVQAAVVVFAGVFGIVNLLTDAVYTVIDPRVRRKA